MRFLNYLLLTLLIIILTFGSAAGAYFFANQLMIVEVDNAIDLACWSGLSVCDLNWLASRKDINVNEYRTIELDKPAAVSKTVDYLKYNLNLDPNWYPLGGPAIDHTRPVVLRSIEIINGSEIPKVVDGHNVNETTIHVVLDVPTRFFKDRYYRRFDRYVDLSDFITSAQTR